MNLSLGYKPAAVVCGAMVLLGGAAVAPAVAVPDPVVDVCGGAVPDYVGLLGTDTAFNGTVTLPAGGTASLTIGPGALAGDVKAEIERNPADSRYAISRLQVDADSSGRGVIGFKTYAGDGWSKSVTCANPLTPTRVTQISGIVEIFSGVGHVVGAEFSVSRT